MTPSQAKGHLTHTTAPSTPFFPCYDQVRHGSGMVGPTGDALLIKQAPPLFLEAFSVAYP